MAEYILGVLMTGANWDTTKASNKTPLNPLRKDIITIRDFEDFSRNRLLSKVTKISCGENFSAALTSDGKLYTWGYGDEGQLGHGMRKDVRAPKQVDFPEQIQKVSCGFAHVGFITATNSLQMFGRGREGQLGREESKNSSALYRLRPSDVEVFSNETIVEVKCGGDHTFAIVNSMKK